MQSTRTITLLNHSNVMTVSAQRMNAVALEIKATGFLGYLLVEKPFQNWISVRSSVVV